MKNGKIILFMMLINSILSQEDVDLANLDSHDTDPRVELMGMIKKNLNAKNSIHRVKFRELVLEYYTSKSIEELRKLKVKKSLTENESADLVFFENLSRYMTENFDDLYINFKDIEPKILNDEIKKGVQYHFSEVMKKHKERINLKHDMDIADHIDELLEKNIDL